MRIKITLIAALVIAGALFVHFQFQKAPRIVHAQSGCDVTSLNGVFGYTLAGFYFDNAGNTNFFSSSGRFLADGQGNVAGSESDSFSGQIVRADPYTGSYTVNSDCTGSLTTVSKSSGTANYDFVLVNGRNQIQMVETDGGTNVSGQASRQ